MIKYYENLWMDDVRDISVDTIALITNKLKNKGIILTDDQEETIYVQIWTALEDISNGNYRNEGN